ncbi:carboxymuconolactone decarboxylase family protein [Nocardioides daphniae]|uniref:Carboxymuconolactone decarboxylase family protein n=1 Tax=Nocardioides daphniae TaxID=402297 RepID=A0A4P7UGB5_9ACTN|nr:carboxymuconolactone decarboxylase family protein [Nocardioides daphniae]QCC78298.1 carboxymuconolactone decarboxylase family protein [Nocardioides daphniae]GGD13772.1 hypothetical protein GCM10007231_11070 [Nocardioides daphniae]
MPSTFRIPAAPMEGPLARVVRAVARRTYGQVPDIVPVMWHHRPLLRATLAHERRIARWSALDPHLSSFAVMAAAAPIGCTWCLDFGYYLAHDAGLDEAKVREVPRWRESDVFTPLEREVMAYAEAMTATPPTVTDEQVAALRSALGERALVELTMMVAVENQRSRFNHAAGLASQGFSDVCALPLAAPAPSAGASAVGEPR